jgi:hypothetical protein
MVTVARDYSSPTAKHNILPAAAMHTPVPRWVIHVISSEPKRLPLITHLRTYRCVAAPLGDQLADPRRGPSHGGEPRQARGCCAERLVARRGAASAVGAGGVGRI